MKEAAGVKITVNKAMLSRFRSETRLEGKLSDLLLLGFIDVNGAILFRALHETTRKIPISDFPDLTGYECFINHVHIEDYFTGPVISSGQLLQQGVAFAAAIIQSLSLSFSGRRFNLIVALNESGCNVRFHVIRSGESWLQDDLEQFGNEAILLIEI